MELGRGPGQVLCDDTVGATRCRAAVRVRRTSLVSTHPADRDELERAVNKALATGEEIDVEYRMTGPDGEVRWIAARGRAEKGDDQQLSVWRSTSRSASGRAARGRRPQRTAAHDPGLHAGPAVRLHRASAESAAGGHPGQCRNRAQDAQQEHVDLAELREICDDIVSEDNRAAEVIRRLGALYKRGDMKMEQLDLNALVRETLDLLRAEILIRHVTPITELAPSLPEVDGGSCSCSRSSSIWSSTRRMR